MIILLIIIKFYTKINIYLSCLDKITKIKNPYIKEYISTFF